MYHQGRGITPVTLIGAILLSAVVSAGITDVVVSPGDAPGGNPSRKDPVVKAVASISGRSAHQPSAGNGPLPERTLSSITVLVNQGGALSPFGIKVGDSFLELHTPMTTPHARLGERRSWRAGLIDTADLLRANGYSAETPFTLVVGGEALTAGNTYRITGIDNQRHPAPEGGGAYSVAYENIPGERGIWRILRFKNFMLSYGYSPGLRDHLLASDGPEQAPAVTTDETHPSLPTAAPQLPSTPVTPVAYPDPRARAAAIVARATRSIEQQATLIPMLTEGLRDQSEHVREASLAMLTTLEGPVPVKTLKYVAMHDDVPALRIHALDLLAAHEGRRALPILNDAHANPDPAVRQAAAQIISSLPTKDSTTEDNGR